MSEAISQRKQLVADWQKKHGVADDDPLFAAVELFEIYANSIEVKVAKESAEPPSFSEFRDTLERLDQISKRFTNVAQDLTNEVRKSLPSHHSDGSGLWIGLSICMGIAGAAAAYFFWAELLRLL